MRRDFLIADAHRLNEHERALMGAMLADLLDRTLDELLAMLPPVMSARIEPSRQEIAGQLWADGALASDSLVSLLLRRSDEQRLLASGRRAAEGSGPIDQLVADPDESIAVAAMALTVGRGRRRDRFGRIGIEIDDLEHREARLLVMRIAATARCQSGLPWGEADEELARAAERLIAAHDGAQALDSLTERLATLLAEAGRATPEAIDSYFRDGEAGLASALLAKRASILSNTGWCLLTEQGAQGLMLLVKMAGIDRIGAAHLIATLGDVLGLSDPAGAIAWFDALAASEVDERRRWFRLPEPYRDALGEAGDHG